MAAGINYHKLSDLKQHKFSVLQFQRSGVQNRAYWANIKVWSGLHSFLEVLWEHPFPCLSRHPESAYIPSLVAPSIIKASNGWSSLSHDAISLILPLLFPSSPFKDPCKYIESTQIIQNNLFKVI